MLVLNISMCFQNINRIANSNRWSQFKSKEYLIHCHNLITAVKVNVNNKVIIMKD